MLNDRPLVIYHAPCLDGFTAAWAMWLKYPHAEFVPGIYGQEPPACKDRHVYLLDFSYKPLVLEAMLRSASKITIIDHHKTAETALAPYFDAGTINGKFDMNQSGAMLAWKWFHPNEPVPLMVSLVEDRDLGHLWRKAGPNFPGTSAINSVLFSYEYNFETWSVLQQLIEDEGTCAALLEQGNAIERKHMKDVKELVSKLQHTRAIGVYDDPGVPCCNLPYTYASDAANLMAKDAPFAATYYQDGNDQLSFSLRSVEGGVDVSEIAAQYGGGGHAHAAGFRVASLEAL